MLSRNILITGCNRGLGLEFVKQLTQNPNPPSKIIATCRDPDAAHELQKIQSSHPQIVHIKRLETTDFDGIKRFSEDIKVVKVLNKMSLFLS